MKIRCLVLVVLMAIPGFAQYGSGKVSGKVTGRDGQPLVGATIAVDRQDVEQHLELKTDKKGEYLRAGMASGSYRIAVMENGVAIAAVGDLKLTFNDQIQQDFDLRKPTTQAGSTVAAGGAVTSQREGATTTDKATRDAENKANSETQGAFNAGVTALNAKNYDEAIKQFSLAAEKRPMMYVIFARLGFTYNAAGRFSEAVTAYQKAADLKPDENSYVYNAGLAACRADQFDVCGAALKKAVTRDPSLGGSSYYTLGAMLAAKGKSSEAEEAFKLSLVHDPNFAESNYQIGLLYLRNPATIPVAVPYFEKYLRIAPTGPNAAVVKQLIDAAKAQQ